MNNDTPMLYIDIPLKDHDIISSCLAEYLKYSQRKFHKEENFNEDGQDNLILTHTLLRGVKEFKNCKIMSKDKIPQSQHFSLLKLEESKALEESLRYGIRRSFLSQNDKTAAKEHLNVLKKAVKEFEGVHAQNTTE